MEEIYSTPFQTTFPWSRTRRSRYGKVPDKLTLYDRRRASLEIVNASPTYWDWSRQNVRVVSLVSGGRVRQQGAYWSHAVICALAARHVNRP